LVNKYGGDLGGGAGVDSRDRPYVEELLGDPALFEALKAEYLKQK